MAIAKWRVIRRSVIAGLLLAAVTVAFWPTTRLIGVNYVVTEHTLPLWTKAVDFIHRDVNMAATARSVFVNAADEDAKLRPRCRGRRRTSGPSRPRCR
jgi:hypothetical protein